MNILLVAFISAFIAIIIQLIYNKISKKDNDKKELIKMGVLGLLLGFVNYIILDSSNTTFSKLLADFETGNPKF